MSRNAQSLVILASAVCSDYLCDFAATGFILDPGGDPAAPHSLLWVLRPKDGCRIQREDQAWLEVSPWKDPRRLGGASAGSAAASGGLQPACRQRGLRCAILRRGSPDFLISGLFPRCARSSEHEKTQHRANSVPVCREIQLTITVCSQGESPVFGVC